jgi:hypothetical protein
MPNQLSRQPVNVGAPDIVKFLASKTENRRTDDGRYVNASAIEDVPVHRRVSYFPFAFSPSSTSFLKASDRVVSLASAQASTSAIKAGGIRAAMWGFRPPFEGLPIFGATILDFFMILVVP